MLADTADRQREIIGERTLLQRRRVRIGQRALARDLGWGPNRVSQVEHARVSLDILELYALADRLECSVEYLLGLVDSPDPSNITARYLAAIDAANETQDLQRETAIAA